MQSRKLKAPKKIDAKLAQLDQTLQETQELGKEIKNFAEKNRQTKMKKLAKLQNDE
jgi:transposase